MIWLLYIIGYAIAPLILFPINDYASGYYEDRLKDLPHLLHNIEKEPVVFGFMVVLWPVVISFMIGVWTFIVLRHLCRNVEYIGKLKVWLENTEERGKARRKKEMDLDYQAEKYLLDKK